MRLTLFVLFLAAMALLRGYLADQWRAGEQRARTVLGEPAGPAGDTAANPPEP